MKTEQYLKRALQSFREENQTLERFLSVLMGLKRIDEPVSAFSLLSVLKAEHTADPLPSEIYDGVSRWIELNADVSRGTGKKSSNVIHIPASKHPANFNRELRKHKARVLNKRYVLIKVIDSSFIGTVYKSIDLRKQEADIPEPYVAIKILKRTFRAHQDWLTTYYKEIHKRQGLTHPNITKVLGLDRDDSTVFIIMEYILGESLAHALNFDDLRQNLIKDDRLLPIIEGMGDALAYSHSRGIVHGNFKPSKVLLTKDNGVKIFDFSIECALSDIDAADPTLELESPLVETRIYASPQVLEYNVPEERDDVFALACTTYELLTGMHPFKRELSTVARDTGIKPKFQQGMSRRQWKALRRALAFDRDKRTPDIEQFLTEFNASKHRFRSFLRVAAGVAAIAATIGIALNYHFSTLEQAKLERDANQRVAQVADKTDSTTLAQHNDSDAAFNQISSSDEVTEVAVTQELLANHQASGVADKVSGGPWVTEPLELPVDGSPTQEARTSFENADEDTETINSLDVAVSGFGDDSRSDEVDREGGQTTGLSESEQNITEADAQLAVAHEMAAPLPGKEQKIARLMGEAKQQINVKQLTTPPGANVLETYREILNIDPEYGPAVRGIEDIKTYFKASSDQAAKKGNLPLAKRMLKKAMAVDPRDFSLRESMLALEQPRRKAVRDKIAIQEAITEGRASEVMGTSLASKTLEKKPTQDKIAAQVADKKQVIGLMETSPVQANNDGQMLQANKITARAFDQKVNALFRKSEQQMAAQRLTLPSGNNARDTLNEIIRIDPNNKKAKEGLETLARELESRAVARQRAGDLDGALVAVKEGLLIRADDSGLRTLQSDLHQQIKLKSKAAFAETLPEVPGIIEVDAAIKSPVPPKQAAKETKPRRRFRAGGTF